MWGIGNFRLTMTLSKDTIVNTKLPWFTNTKFPAIKLKAEMAYEIFVFPEGGEINLKSHLKIQTQELPPQITIKRNFEVSNQSTKIWTV